VTAAPHALSRSHMHVPGDERWPSLHLYMKAMDFHQTTSRKIGLGLFE